MVAASKEWEQFALRLVSSSIASPDDFESLSGKEDFLLTFADVIQQTSFLGDLQAYVKEYAAMILLVLVEYRVALPPAIYQSIEG